MSKPVIPATQKIGIPPGTSALRLERIKQAYGPHDVPHHPGYWQLWIHASPDWQYGTVIRLFDTGRIERVQFREDGTDDFFLIKPED